MTSQSPRIYTYKITFEEVPYYYYGVKKEKYYNQEYWGSPKTHRWCWEFYTPKKQILEVFDYTDEGWLEAQEVEKRLIAPVFNADKWCLNESCGGKISLAALRVSGKKAGIKAKENRTGIFALSPEQMKENSRKSGLTQYQNKTGVFSRSKEEMTEHGRKSGLKCKENGTGIFTQTEEERKELERKSCAQKWKCIETGHIANPGNLTIYQRKRGIDTTKRERVS